MIGTETTWAEFLKLLQNPLIEAAVGLMWFFFWEYIPEMFSVLGLGTGWFDTLDQFPKRKRLLIGFMALAAPVTAYLLEVATVTGGPVYLDSTVYDVTPGVGIWYALVAGAVAVTTSTALHTTKLTGEMQPF